ncbi:hypothetical protein [Massilia sp. CT11-137]|uniref:hypothetical protein n=1 Tax=Massilia sp. CT11-137 TaxID=3393901 RepID=UPI0039AEEEB7
MDQGSHVLADDVLGFLLSYDSQNNLFHFDFDIGSKTRAIWIPVGLLSQIGVLAKDWRNLGQHSPIRLKAGSEQAPILIKLRAQSTTDDGAMLHLETQSGRIVGLKFPPIVWREFLTALRK